jgi:hypothetical protein
MHGEESSKSSQHFLAALVACFLKLQGQIIIFWIGSSATQLSVCVFSLIEILWLLWLLDLEGPKIAGDDMFRPTKQAQI